MRYRCKKRNGHKLFCFCGRTYLRNLQKIHHSRSPDYSGSERTCAFRLKQINRTCLGVYKLLFYLTSRLYSLFLLGLMHLVCNSQLSINHPRFFLSYVSKFNASTYFCPTVYSGPTILKASPENPKYVIVFPSPLTAVKF